MCGIAGWIGLGEGLRTLTAMTGAIAHRGPDGEGAVLLPVERGLTAGLGHRRLSIIDLATGAQPMESHDGRFTIVFNGEIYNYVELRHELRERGATFRSHSDTEVILEAWRLWGEESLNRLRGMFAFALHDRDDQSVVLARDPFGKKPVFFTAIQQRGGEGLVFASEITGLLAHPAVACDLDPAALHDYLCWRYVPGPNTFFRAIRKLGPGSLIHWKAGIWREMRYWTPPEARQDDHPPPADPVGEFLEIFDESVRLRMRADVPVGAFLSSGLDSSSIVATLRHLGIPEIRTFSVGFRGDLDAELPAAAETARLFGTIHTPVELETDQMLGLLPKLSWHRGAPLSETADMPIYMMSLEAARHVKVVLSGEGSDELFAGYPKHLAEAHLGVLGGAGRRPAGVLLGAMAHAFPRRGRRFAIAGRALRETVFEERMVRWFGALTPAERRGMWRGPIPEQSRSVMPFSAAPDASPLRRILHFDQTSWLPDNLLERMDSMTMAASIEARAPFMDVRLGEYAARLPDNWRIKGMTSKRIVREALRPRLPEAVLTRPKNGFRMPVAAWFRGPLREQFHDLLLAPDAVSRPYLDANVLRRLIDDHAGGGQDHSKTLWSFFAMEVFLRAFFSGSAASC